MQIKSICRTGGGLICPGLQSFARSTRACVALQKVQGQGAAQPGDRSACTRASGREESGVELDCARDVRLMTPRPHVDGGLSSLDVSCAEKIADFT